MALTYRNLIDEVGVRLDIDVTAGGELDTTVKRYINLAGRYLWNARPWEDRWKEGFITTVDPYTDGTITTTEGSTSITGASTTWTTSHTGYKIATGYSETWYRFTRTAAGTGTLGLAWVGDAVTASAYVLYQDEFDMATDVDTILSVSIMKAGSKMSFTPLTLLDETVLVHGSIGQPEFYSVTTPTTAGTKRIRLYPIPNGPYAIRYQYAREWTDLSADGDLHALGADRDLLLLEASCLLSQGLSDARQVTSQEAVDALLEKTWRDTRAIMQPRMRRRTFDSGIARARWHVNLPD